MGRAFERRDQLPHPRGDLCDQDVGEAAAGLFGGARRRDLGGQRILMQPLDHGAEQRFLGLEMMVQRLPRQAGSFRRLLDRRAPEALPAEHRHGGIEDAVARLHLTILTKEKKCQMTKPCGPTLLSAAPPMAVRSPRPLRWIGGYKLREGLEAWLAAGHRGFSRRNRSRSANRSRRPCAPGLSSIASAHREGAGRGIVTDEPDAACDDSHSRT